MENKKQKKKRKRKKKKPVFINASEQEIAKTKKKKKETGKKKKKKKAQLTVASTQTNRRCTHSKKTALQLCCSILESVPVLCPFFFSLSFFSFQEKHELSKRTSKATALAKKRKNIHK